MHVYVYACMCVCICVSYSTLFILTTCKIMTVMLTSVYIQIRKAIWGLSVVVIIFLFVQSGLNLEKNRVCS